MVILTLGLWNMAHSPDANERHAQKQNSSLSRFSVLTRNQIVFTSNDRMEGNVQPPTVREVIRRLEDEGFEHVRTVGDHRRYAKGSLRVTVAGKLSDHLHPKTWKNVREQAGW